MEGLGDIIKHISMVTGIPEGEFDGQTELYGSGIVSSLMMLELMSTIEKEYHIFIRPEELIEDNFATVRSLMNFIRRKQSEDTVL